MIKVITGPMFSGKSTALLNYIAFIEEQNIPYCIFKPSKDKRDLTRLRARTTSITKGAKVISNLEEIRPNLLGVKTIIIDEFQFLKGDIRELLKLSKEGCTIVAAGLNLTSDLKPFGLMPDLLSIADQITKLQGTCVFCGGYADFTGYKGEETKEIKFGDDRYFPVCLNCLKNF